MLVATTGASLLMVSCGGASDGPLDARIVIENFSFGGDVSMPVGSTATVTNRDGVAHTWTADSGAFDSDVIEPDASFSFTFDQPGDIPFFCSIHPSMTGVVSITG